MLEKLEAYSSSMDLSSQEIRDIEADVTEVSVRDTEETKWRDISLEHKRELIRSALPKLGQERVRQGMESFGSIPCWRDCFCALAYGPADALDNASWRESSLPIQDFAAKALGLTVEEVGVLSLTHSMLYHGESEILREECEKYLAELEEEVV